MNIARAKTLPPKHGKRQEIPEIPSRSATSAKTKGKETHHFTEKLLHLPHIHHKSDLSDATPGATTTKLDPDETGKLNAQASRVQNPPKMSPRTSTASGTTAATNRPSTTKRPDIPMRQNSIQTRYISMLLSMDDIPRIHNIAASFFTWVLLAGFIIFPGTFTSIQTLSNDPNIESNGTASSILDHVKSIPLLVIAGICCGIGVVGMIWLWWRWRNNFVWLLNRIFLPGCLNGLAGFISTVTNVYGQQDGDWSVTARVTAIVTGVCTVVTAILFLIYNYWALKRVKNVHRRQMKIEAPEDEGLGEKIVRKVNEPALEPGSVV